MTRTQTGQRQQPRHYTHYWNTSTCEFQPAGVLDHTAGNDFGRTGVQPGDFVYVTNILRGRLRFIGRMQVQRIVSYDEACRLLDCDLWEADEHCIAVPETATRMSFERYAPLETARRLRFVRADGTIIGLTFRAGDPQLLEQQTLRSVRRLTPESAELLDELIEV